MEHLQWVGDGAQVHVSFSKPWTPRRAMLKGGNKGFNLLLALHQTSDPLVYPCTSHPALSPTFQLWPPCSPGSPPVSSDSSHTRLLRVSQTGPAVPYMRTFTFAIPSVQNTDPFPLPTPLTFKNQLVSRPNLLYIPMPPSPPVYTHTHTLYDLRHSSSLLTAIAPL